MEMWVAFLLGVTVGFVIGIGVGVLLSHRKYAPLLASDACTYPGETPGSHSHARRGE